MPPGRSCELWTEGLGPGEHGPGRAINATLIEELGYLTSRERVAQVPTDRGRPRRSKPSRLAAGWWQVKQVAITRTYPEPPRLRRLLPGSLLSAPDQASDQDRRGRCSYALHCDIVRPMEVRATVTSKGQVTIPVAVREALGIRRGTRILFRVEDERVLIELEGSNRQVVMETFPDFFALAGSVAVPAGLRGASWKTIRRRARSDSLARIGRGTR